jgi:hypothetical protein
MATPLVMCNRRAVFVNRNKEGRGPRIWKVTEWSYVQPPGTGSGVVAPAKQGVLHVVFFLAIFLIPYPAFKGSCLYCKELHSGYAFECHHQFNPIHVFCMGVA